MADTATTNPEDRVFCHACGHVWLKAEHDLTCPRCYSDFTEIVEIPPETPPESPIAATGEGRVPPTRTGYRDPWADFGDGDGNDDDNNDGDDHHDGRRTGPGFTQRTYRSPDGRFTFTSTTFSSNRAGGEGGRGNDGDLPRRPPIQNGGFPEDPLLPIVRTLDTIFHGLADTYRQQGRRPAAGSQRQGDRDTPMRDEWDDPEEVEPEPGPWGREGLYPRDANGPQPMGHPVGSLNDLLELFRQDYGPGGTAPGGGGGVVGGGVRIMGVPNPLAMLHTFLSIPTNGDAVYSQEELDRVISQLIDQSINSNAPPPASDEAIRSLPMQKVDTQMLGPEGKAECSICMEAVDVGTEVTVLPCKHWFHFPCIEAWLKQHNTCPHCRRGINATAQPYAEGSPENPVVIDSNSPQPSPSRSQDPGSSSTVEPPHWGRQNSDSRNSEGQSRGNSGGGDGGGGGGYGGITGWVRNRFGGG